MTNGLSDAEIQGQKLAKQLMDTKPIENFTNTGVLQIRDANGTQKEFLVQIRTIITTTNWQNIYESVVTNRNGYTDGDFLKIAHENSEASEYVWNNYDYNLAKIAPYRSNI